MAVRPVYCTLTTAPFVTVEYIDFQYFSGFSVTQKQKSILSLHKNFLEKYPQRKILEISTKSNNDLGVKLSAFNLMIHTNERAFSVESAFQSSKVFENGGPYTDLLNKSSKEAKKDPRIRNSGKLKAFHYFNSIYPLEPKDYFYNWLYINTLFLNNDLSEKIQEYDCFTDIEFNPQRSINCQAKAAAIFTGLAKAGVLKEALNDRNLFLKLVYNYEKTKEAKEPYSE